jgi:hypothetical protein
MKKRRKVTPRRLQRTISRLRASEDAGDPLAVRPGLPTAWNWQSTKPVSLLLKLPCAAIPVPISPAVHCVSGRSLVIPTTTIVYRPETSPLQVVAVLHGKRNIRGILKNLANEQAAHFSESARSGAPLFFSANNGSAALSLAAGEVGHPPGGVMPNLSRGVHPPVKKGILILDLTPMCGVHVIPPNAGQCILN